MIQHEKDIQNLTIELDITKEDERKLKDNLEKRMVNISIYDPELH